MTAEKRRTTPLSPELIRAPHCSTELRLNILHQVPFYRGLSHKGLTRIAGDYRDIGNEPGDTIYRSGTTVTHAYVIATGKVKLIVHSDKGQNVLLDVLGPGEFFGILPVGNTTKTQTDTAIALTHTCVLAIGAMELREILEQHASVAIRLMEILTNRLEQSRERIRQLNVFSVEERLAYTLIKLAEKMGEPGTEGLLIQTPLSRADLAELAGTTPETTSRIVHQFETLGLIRTGRKWVAVSRLAELKKIVS